ncbi:hypothetical protein [Streptomyces inhibens]|uniref:hypothetical protein n=1 Tax=Streptomyces inhibens TaxID=2293571 RepID=UPI000FFC7B0F|nr:hypothetical protein [Streptomyces inhibens]
MTGAYLPAGWTLQQIRDVSGDQQATALNTSRTVMWCVPDAEEVVHPEIVLRFHSLCLVKPVHDNDWYMGSLNDDGSIDCWSAYDDLYEALRGL